MCQVVDDGEVELSRSAKGREGCSELVEGSSVFLDKRRAVGKGLKDR
jgi:hypothetical protein